MEQQSVSEQLKPALDQLIEAYAADCRSPELALAFAELAFKAYAVLGHSEGAEEFLKRCTAAGWAAAQVARETREASKARQGRS